MKRDDGNSLVKRTIGVNVRSLRKASGRNQTEFAEIVGINRSYLSQIESGKMNVSVSVLVKIANGLDVPLAELLIGLGDRAPYRLADGNGYALVGIPLGKKRAR